MPDPAREALDAAQRLAAEGKFADALEKHLWFHDHALEVERSYYGVRLSYALAYWKELGQKYPPALLALRDIRDRKTSRLLAGETDRELFHDVVAINERLEESSATVDLFKRIEAIDPKFATSVYHLADSALVAAREFTIARRHLGDLSKRFLFSKRHFDEGMEFSGTARAAEASRRATESIFVEDVVRLMTVLDKTGDRAAAQSIQAKALAVLPSPAISNALED